MTTVPAVHVGTVTLVAPETAAVAPVLAAVQAAYPAAAVRRFPRVDLACAAAPGAGLEVLAAFATDPAEVGRAAAALDGRALPRWAVIDFGPASPAASAGTLVSSASADWPPAALAELLRAVAARHRTERDRVELLGDLRTIGTRVVHDLRTPLSGILTTAEVLSETLAEASPENSGLARSIIACSDELKKILQQLSALAKATTHPPVCERLNMGLAVAPALMRLERLAAQHAMAVSAPPAWPEVLGDVAWLDLIWSNLVGNALRHAGPNRRVTLGWEPAGDAIRFWVSDDGAGPANPESLWREFHRLDQPNAGHGLGLALVHRLVQRQGGRCAYAPRTGGGSIFSFFLPAAGNPA